MLTGQWRLIDRSYCADPGSVSLIGELIIEGTHQRARPEPMQGSSAPRSTSTTLEPTSQGCGGGTGMVGLALASFPNPAKRSESPSRTLPQYVLLDLGLMADHIDGDPVDLPDR